jgi:general secretion pathway protein D
VNVGGLALLDIAQEVRDVVPTTTSGLDSPTIRQRKVSSTVAAQSGESVALGGLIRDSRVRSREGVPMLSRLPVVGPLFGTKDVSSARTELLVLITPRVIRDPREARQVAEELRGRLRQADAVGVGARR